MGAGGWGELSVFVNTDACKGSMLISVDYKFNANTKKHNLKPTRESYIKVSPSILCC